jgi:hypothetical protein
MNKSSKYSAHFTHSPWLDTNKTNLFRDEFRLAEKELSEKDLPGSCVTPIEPYRWIYQNQGENLFFRGLARFAPMFPLRAYLDQEAIWASPPPSGYGNAIYMVMGHDTNGVLRLVGGNYFTETTSNSGVKKSTADFFGQYDKADKYKKERLVRETIERSITRRDTNFLLNVRRECEHFHTMPIYITVLTPEGSMFHAGKAVIEGRKTADFSYEYFGEIL